MSILNPIRQTPLPLFRKEMLERAARPRTYTVRRIYALLFFALILWQYHRLVHLGGSPPGAHNVRGLEALGKGEVLFGMAVGTQIWGIYLFLPAMMAGVFAGERERGTLSLLFTTPLSTRSIVVEKYLAAIVPMLIILSLTFVVGGFASFLGGLTATGVAIGTSILLLTATATGAITLFASALAATTVKAYLTSLVLLVVYIGIREFMIAPLFAQWGVDAFGLICFHFFTTIILLFAAWVVLDRLASGSSNTRLSLFQRLDRLLDHLNKRFGGVEFRFHREDLPRDAPLLWREQHRRQLSKSRYQMRYFLILEIVAIALAWFNPTSLTLVSITAWIVTALILVSQAASLFPAERNAQTLGILLTTPMPRSRMLLEKALGLLPLAALLSILILTLALFRWRELQGSSDPHLAPHFFATELIHVLVFPPFFIALGLAVSIHARQAFQAIVIALAILVVCSVHPIVLRFLVPSIPWSEATFVYASPALTLCAHHWETDFHQTHILAHGIAITASLALTLALYGWAVHRTHDLAAEH